MKKVIFTMGLPGAGKSRVLKTEYNEFIQNAVMIDPDEIKKEKADYNPKQPQVYHVWSKDEAQKRMYAAMIDGFDVVIDGTGTNVEKMIKWIREFHLMGYDVEVVYVKVSIDTAMYRNANRERVVPEYLIREKAETIELAFELIGKEADVTVVNND